MHVRVATMSNAQAFMTGRIAHLRTDEALRKCLGKLCSFDRSGTDKQICMRQFMATQCGLQK